MLSQLKQILITGVLTTPVLGVGGDWVLIIISKVGNTRSRSVMKKCKNNSAEHAKLKTREKMVQQNAYTQKRGN